MPFVPRGSFFVSDPELGSKLLKSERDFAQQKEANRQADRLFKANKRQARIENRQKRKELLQKQQANEDVNKRFFFGQDADTQRLLIQQGFLDKRGGLDRTSRENISADANAAANARNAATIEAQNQRAAAQRAQEQQKIDNAESGKRALTLVSALREAPKGTELRKRLLFGLADMVLPEEDVASLKQLTGDSLSQALDVLNQLAKDGKDAVRKNADNPQALSVAVGEATASASAKIESILGTDSAVIDVISQIQADINTEAKARATTAGQQAALNTPEAIAGAGRRAGAIANAQQQAKVNARETKPVALNTAERRQAQSAALLDAGVISSSAQEDAAAIAASERAEDLANQFGLDEAAVRRITTTEFAKDSDRIFTFVGPGDANDTRFASSIDEGGFFSSNKPLPEQPIARQVVIKMQRQARVFVETEGQAGLDPGSPQWSQALLKAFKEGLLLDKQGNVKDKSSAIAQAVASSTGELLSAVDRLLGR